MTRIRLLASLATAALTVSACSSGGGTTSSTTTTTGTGGSGAGGSGGAGGTERPPVAVDKERDILTTDLVLDVTTLAGKATLTLAPSASKAVSFEVGDLAITAVSDADGPLNFAVANAQLDVGVPVSAGPTSLTVEYTFKAHSDFDGWMPSSDVSFLWPYFCGNLFPCKSATADGVKFTMSVTGVPA
ncbi:MAG: hypothetical protein ABI193_06720, partial [Minicystis sp.]